MISGTRPEQPKRYDTLQNIDYEYVSAIAAEYEIELGKLRHAL